MYGSLSYVVTDLLVRTYTLTNNVLSCIPKNGHATPAAPVEFSTPDEPSSAGGTT